MSIINNNNNKQRVGQDNRVTSPLRNIFTHHVFDRCLETPGDYAVFSRCLRSENNNKHLQRIHSLFSIELNVIISNVNFISINCVLQTRA